MSKGNDSIPPERRRKQIERELDKLADYGPKWEALYREQCQIDAIFAERNLKGQQLEKQGNIEEAIQLYEQNVADEFGGNHPYTRLAVIYRKQGRLEDEIRVLKESIRILGHSEQWEGQLIKALKKKKGS